MRAKSEIHSQCKLEVAEWQDTQPAAVYRETKPPKLWVHPLIGALLALLVHGVAVTIVYESAGPSGQLAKIRNAGAAVHWNVPDSLTLIDLPAQPEVRFELDDSLSAVLKMTDIKPALDLDSPALPSIESVEPGDSSSPDAASPATAGGDPLLAIYLRQIQARIERVWRRPRTLVAEGMLSKLRRKDEPFQCEVHITQDPHGNVEDIRLGGCNGSFAWQQSLVSAIHQASPLPGPPSASIYRSSVDLMFTARAYRPGAPTDEYETQSSQLVSAQ